MKVHSHNQTFIQMAIFKAQTMAVSSVLFYLW